MPNDEEKEWVRGPKKANLGKVPVSKIVKAHQERGINVEANKTGKEAVVTKTIVTGIPPAPIGENR